MGQPSIELIEGIKALCDRFNPDVPPTVLDVLLHHALFPTRGNLAELWFKQVVAAHGREARVDISPLVPLDLGGFHIVLNAAQCTPPKAWNDRERIKEHVAPLARISHPPERPACAWLRMHHLDSEDGRTCPESSGIYCRSPLNSEPSAKEKQ